MSSKPNIAFVHGAWADGSSCSKGISSLQGKGFKVSAAQIPLTSLTHDIATTQRLLSSKKGPSGISPGVCSRPLPWIETQDPRIPRKPR
jgi:hypothetical protein